MPIRSQYAIALIVTVLLLGLQRVFEPPHLTKDLLYTIFLPGLLFEAAFRINFEQFWRNKLTVFSLAVPGVIAATAITTVILMPVSATMDYVQNFSWRFALLFGALIAATNPIAVFAMFKELGAPKRLSVLILLQGLTASPLLEDIDARLLQLETDQDEPGSP